MRSNSSYFMLNKSIIQPYMQTLKTWYPQLFSHWTRAKKLTLALFWELSRASIEEWFISAEKVLRKDQTLQRPWSGLKRHHLAYHMCKRKCLQAELESNLNKMTLTMMTWLWQTINLICLLRKALIQSPLWLRLSFLIGLLLKSSL